MNEQPQRPQTSSEPWDHKGLVRARYPDAPAELYEDLREKWKHEDELINRRVTWLLTSQVLFFTTYGIIVTYRMQWAATKEMRVAHHFWHAFSPFSLAELIVVVCALAVVYFLQTGIEAAIDAMTKLNARLRVHKKARRVWSGMKIDVVRDTTQRGARPARVMAYVFLASWVLIAVYELCRVLLPFIWPMAPIL